MRSVENSPSRQRSSPSGEMIFLQADNVESKCAILISAMISFKISRPRFQDQDWRSNDDASNCSRRKSAKWKTACVFHSGGHCDERNDVTLRFETFRYQARLHRVEYLAIDDSSKQGTRVARSNAEEEARTQDMLGRCTVVRRDQDCAAQFAIRRRGISQGLGAAMTTIQRVLSTSAHFAHHA